MRNYGLYSRRITALHRLHPVTKLVCAVILVLSPLLASDLKPSASYLLCCLVLVGAAHGWSSLRRLAPIVVAMALVTVVVWPFFCREGRPVFSVLGLLITQEGFQHGVAMACRLVSFILVGVVFLTVTRVEELMTALSRLGLPFPLTFSLTLSFRLAPAFMTTIETIRDAQRARGHTVDKGNLIRRAAKHVPLIIPVILHAIRATDVLAMALESRGFGKNARRTSIVRLSFSARDVAALAVTMLAPAALLAWRLAL